MDIVFGMNHNNFSDQVSSFTIISIPIIVSPLLMLLNNYNDWYKQIFHIGILLAIPLLKQYNGKPGGNKNSKWFFYIFLSLAFTNSRLNKI